LLTFKTVDVVLKRHNFVDYPGAPSYSPGTPFFQASVVLAFFFTAAKTFRQLCTPAYRAGIKFTIAASDHAC
jgi:hypothetical protein